MARLDTVGTEKGTFPPRQEDWGMHEESGLAGGCGPGYPRFALRS